MTITETARRAGVRERFAAFIAERHPFALKPSLAAFDRGGDFEPALREALMTGIAIPETTPGVSASERLQQAVSEVVEACRGFLRREEIADSLTEDEKVDILRGMILTRALDNRLGCYVALEAARRVAGESPGDVVAIAATQEETGVHAIRSAVFTLDPDVALVFDVTATSDAPSGPNKPSIVITGSGAQAHTVQLMARRGTSYTITASAGRFSRKFCDRHNDMHGAAFRQVSRVA